MDHLVWARHAESTWNVLGRWQGQSDPGLSPAGRIQAERLAASLRANAPALVIASDLRRAAETARILAHHLDLPVELEPRLRERALGAWTGLQHHQVAARWPKELEALRARNLELRPPGGESLLEVQTRIADWLREREPALRAHRTLVVTHGGLLRALFVERFANTETRVSSLDELWQTLAVHGPRRRPA